MNIVNLFLCVATLKYTYCSQWRTTSKSCSAPGEGMMDGRDSIPLLLVQKLTWRWWQQPKTLLVPTNLEGKQRLVRASRVVLLWANTYGHQLFHVMGNKLSLNGQILPALMLRVAWICSTELPLLSFLKSFFNTVKKSALVQYPIFCLHANLITRINITPEDKKSMKWWRDLYLTFLCFVSCRATLTLCRVSVSIIQTGMGATPPPFKNCKRCHEAPIWRRKVCRIFFFHEETITNDLDYVESDL